MPAFPARIAILCLAMLLASFPARAHKENSLTFGEVLYLPIYSHIYHGDLDAQGKPTQTLLSVHVSVRNTNTLSSLQLVFARYYDTDGRLVREFVPRPVTIPPMGTYELFVPRSDTTGGSGANFLLSWKAAAAVNPPLVEALHSDIQNARTLIFSTQAVAVSPKPK